MNESTAGTSSGPTAVASSPSQQMDPTGNAATLVANPGPDFIRQNHQLSESPNDDINRLRSIAKYHAFQPQALACSSDFVPKSSSIGAIAGPRGLALFKLTNPSQPLVVFPHAMSSSSSAPYSSRQSISALSFRPSVQTTTSSSTHWISSTSDGQQQKRNLVGGSLGSNVFSTTRSLYLAAARGSGVLIFDASGHSPNPLQGRLVADPFDSTAGGGGSITSMSWKPTTPSQNAVLLATTTASSLSIWDLRLSTSHNSYFKPALRFGASQINSTSIDAYSSTVGENGQRLNAPIVSVVCSSSPSSEQCATLDASGVVRIHDFRMTERGSSSVSALTSGAGDTATKGSPVATFAAHGAGIGILHVPSESDNKETWVTWGLESPRSYPIVKVWRPTNQHEDQLQMSTSSFNSSDDYWFLGTGADMKSTSSPPRRPHGRIGNVDADYNVVAKFESPNQTLTCARVCPFPMKDSIVVLGLTNENRDTVQDTTNMRGCGWWAELLQLSSSTDGVEKSTDDLAGSFGLESLATFRDSTTMIEHNETLGSALGKFHGGNLQAAELAFAPVQDSSASFSQETTAAVIDGQNGNSMELLLCCLSDTGVITTTSIPEADLQFNFDSKHGHESATSPGKKKLQNRQHPLPSIASQMRARLFPEESRAGNGLMDVAGSFNDFEKGSNNHFEMADKAHFADEKRSKSPTKPVRVEQEQRLLPFDMEIVPSTMVYGPTTSNAQVGIVGATGGLASSLIDSDDNIEARIQNESSSSHPIDAERVPCPRLCGVSFGHGGLVVFRNGKVQQMWQWYQKVDTDTKTSAAALAQQEMVQSDDLGKDFEKDGKRNLHRSSSTPRSMKELLDMISAAKEAQWGEENDGSADDTLSIMNDFFDDESDSNSDESGGDDDGNEEDNDVSTPVASKDIGMYNRYFGNVAWKGTVDYDDDRPIRPQNLTAGPTTDMLQPVVEVHNASSSIKLDKCRMFYAQSWKLGRLNAKKLNREQHNEEFQIKTSQPNQDGMVRTVDRTVKLPHYRDLVSSSPTKGNGFSKAQSDPNMMLEQATDQKILSNAMDEPGVHGGQLSVRPGQTESMAFLKKLLVSQQKGSGSTLAAFTSPPDKMDSDINTVQKDVFVADRHSSEHSRGLGVHTVRISTSKRQSSRSAVIKETVSVCRHNARVCSDYGDRDRESVWNLLADTLMYELNDKSRVMNGWGGPGGGALGSEMVSNFLSYFERIGDFQMLASIFCVLDATGGYEELPSMLIKRRRSDYDNYIRRYADLLYRWKMLNIRAEVNKHLSPNASYWLNRVHTPSNDVSGEEEMIVDSIGIAIFCPKCKREVNSKSNYCSSCQDFALRCTICEIPVRGLLTLCEKCGHGGHLEHLMTWFQTHSFCPTGCGCQCSLQTIPTSGSKWL